MNPPPPTFPASGHVTASTNATATAASTALPPRFMTSAPMREAMTSTEATMACLPRTGRRDSAARGTAMRRMRMQRRFMTSRVYRLPGGRFGNGAAVGKTKRITELMRDVGLFADVKRSPDELRQFVVLAGKREGEGDRFRRIEC